MFLFLFLFFISVAAASAEKTQKELDLIKNSEVAADKERSEHRGEHWETLTQREFDLIKNAKEKADKERGGQWEVLIKNSNVYAMHMALLPNNKMLIFESSDSVEYDFRQNKVRPLQLKTNAWSSSGAMSADGHLIQTGGFNDGDRAVRRFIPCNSNSSDFCIFIACDSNSDSSDFCGDWTEEPEGLAKRRWFSTDQILPDGRIIILGGRGQLNYEFVPKTTSCNWFPFPFLQESNNNLDLYPFIHLAPDGNLFIFANTKSILFDYVNNRVLRRYPNMPGYSRNYPNSGSSVLLPLDPGAVDAEVLICGGGAASAYSEAKRGNFLNASTTCGRLRFTDQPVDGEDPQWQMEKMPMPRVMGDMVLLPTGDVLIINGASKGSAGWGMARDPVLQPLLYKPGTRKFEVLNPSVTPRLYHSSCHVLPDGGVLVGGRNAKLYNHNNSTNDLEAFSPPYLAAENDSIRPFIALMLSTVMPYGRLFTFNFILESLVGNENYESLSVTILAPSFTTHGYSMNQRLLTLQTIFVLKYIDTFGLYQITVTAPRSAALAPPGYYLLFVVHAGIPSRHGEWVKLTL